MTTPNTPNTPNIPAPITDAIATMRARLDEIRPLVEEADQLEEALIALERLVPPAATDDDTEATPAPAPAPKASATAEKPATIGRAGSMTGVVLDAVKKGKRTTKDIRAAAAKIGKPLTEQQTHKILSRLVKEGALHRAAAGVYVPAPTTTTPRTPTTASEIAAAAAKPAAKAAPKKAGRKRAPAGRSATVEMVRAYIAKQPTGDVIRAGAVTNALGTSRSSVDASLKNLVAMGELVRYGDHLPPTSAQRGYKAVTRPAPTATEGTATNGNGNGTSAASAEPVATPAGWTDE